MKFYVAYKFTHIGDKDNLKIELLNFARILEEIGHKTFMLARDVQKWDNTNHSIPHKTVIITSNINASDAVVAYVNSDVFSKGMLFEFIYSAFTGKKLYVVTKKEYLNWFLQLFSSEVILYSQLSDLETALKCLKI